MKSKADKLDDNKLVPVCVDLSKLSDAVKNDVVEKLLKSKLLKIKYLILLTQLLILLLMLKEISGTSQDF